MIFIVARKVPEVHLLIYVQAEEFEEYLEIKVVCIMKSLSLYLSFS